MSAFERFKGQSTHAQPVETKDGGWKAHMDAGEKRMFNTLSIIKGAALVGLAAGALALIASPLGVAAGVVYVWGAAFQGLMRTDAEVRQGTPLKGISSTQIKNWAIKNWAKCLVKPF